MATTTVRLDSGDKVHLYDNGAGWNGSEGRMATAEELAEARAIMDLDAPAHPACCAPDMCGTCTPPPSDHATLLAALRADGHNVALWADDPSGLRAYAAAIDYQPPEPTADERTDAASGTHEEIQAGIEG
jgi:hypothetical protein